MFRLKYYLSPNGPYVEGGEAEKGEEGGEDAVDGAGGGTSGETGGERPHKPKLCPILLVWRFSAGCDI